MKEFFNNLEKVLEKLFGEFCSLILIIVMIGIISSGKSIFVNLLCEVEIVFMVVSEMSVGVVIIEYSDKIFLVIDEIFEVIWECGE